MKIENYDVLITGGSGFIGSAIAGYLIRTGKRVVCLDDNTDNIRLESIKDHDSLCLVNGCVLQENTVDYWVERCERVIHLAAIVGVDEYITRSLDVLDVNILGTRNVLMACLKHNKPVLMASTSEIYGKNSIEPLHEDSDRIYGTSLNNRWCYAISKSTTEHYAHALKEKGLIYTIVRFFNAYGPMIDSPGKGRVISKFIGALMENKPLFLVDGGKAVRAFCYIDDVVEAVTTLILTLNRESSFFGRGVNIGCSDPVTIEELANLMIELNGNRNRTVSIDGKELFGKGFEEIPNRVPDTSFLREAINFKAKVNLREGLKRTMECWGVLAEEKRDEKPETVKRKICMVRPYFSISDQLLEKFYHSMKKGLVTNNGNNLKMFEERLAEYFNVDDLVVVSSGADALLMAVKSLNCTGKIILPSYTFMATLNAVILNGCEPIFCDIDPETFTLSPDHLKKIVERESNVCAIMPVNVFGVAPDLKSISEIAGDIKIIYDNAHGFGAKYRDKRVYDQSYMEIYSFHATKILPAIEGGSIITRNREALENLKKMRNHGISGDLLDSTPGINSKMDELRSATGVAMLQEFHKVLERRKAYAGRLRDCFNAYPDFYRVQKVPHYADSNFQNLGVVCKFAESSNLLEVIDQFKKNGVECRSYFNIALHRLNMFHQKISLPWTEKIADSLLCFPLHSYMKESELEQIEEAIVKVKEHYQTR